MLSRNASSATITLANNQRDNGALNSTYLTTGALRDLLDCTNGLMHSVPYRQVLDDRLTVRGLWDSQVEEGVGV